MLDTPYFITVNDFDIESVFSPVDQFVIVSLPLDGEESLNNYIVDNYVVKAILEKYPHLHDFFFALKFEDDLDFTWDQPLFGTHLYHDIEKELGTIDIIFDKYESLSETMQKRVNTHVRMNSVCKDGKLLFHIQSKFTYRELVSQGVSFYTYCDQEKILLNHEIQQLTQKNIPFL